MGKCRLARAAALAMLAQTVSVGVSALTVFLLASVLSPGEYGLWQFYLLLGSFSGLFHLGLCDGVYLRLGGQLYDRLDMAAEGSMFHRMTAIMGTLAAVGVGITIIVGGMEGRAGGIALALAYMPMFNAAAYLGFVQQATDNTAAYSISVVIERLSFGGAVAVAAALGAEDFRVYALCSIAAKLAALGYLIFKTRRLVLSPPVRGNIWQRVRGDISAGFRLMSANLAGQLTTGAARLAVIYRYGDAVFGRVSFAMTLSGLFLQFVSQLTMVLFPALRRQDGPGRREAFRRLGRLSRLLLPGVLLAYLPLRAVISAWLPAYSAGMEYLLALLPLSLFDGNVHLVGAADLKVAGRVGTLWWMELLSAGASLVLCFGAGYAGASVGGILWAAVLAAALRSLLFDVTVGEGQWKNTGGLVLCASVFVLTASLMWDVAAMLTYGVFYLCYVGITLRRRDGLAILTK